jgi:hypothetical protein
MLLPSLIAVVILLAPVAYVAWRKLSVVEQEITFDEPQRGVAGVSLTIQDDQVQRLRIVYGDGEVCEIFPIAARCAAREARAESDLPGPSRDAQVPIAMRAAARPRPRLSPGRS